MLIFALLIIAALFNGEYFEEKKNSSRKGGQPWETGGRLVEEGVGGSKGGVFVWMVFEMNPGFNPTTLLLSGMLTHYL